MNGGARIAGYSVGALMIAGGLVLHARANAGIGLLVIGVLVVVGIALEPRYRRGKGDGAGAWQPTGERFLDDETGELVEVWYDPRTGQRDYRRVNPK